MIVSDKYNMYYVYCKTKIKCNKNKLIKLTCMDKNRTSIYSKKSKQKLLKIFHQYNRTILFFGHLIPTLNKFH